MASHLAKRFELAQLTQGSCILTHVLIIGIPLCMQINCQSHFTASDNKEEFTLHSRLKDATRGQLTGESHVDLPLLIWWTNEIFPRENRETLSKIKCNIGQCFATANRRYLNDRRTQAFIFYGTHTAPDDLPLPRQPWHFWALFHEESPLNNYILCHQNFLRLFNFTATSRSESDFPLTMQWIPNNDYFTSKSPISLALKNKLKKEKDYAPVLYIQSHCAVPSDRDRYVKELMKYIKIDSYGKCLNNKNIPKKFEDPADNLKNQDFYDFIAPYKFHLAFENSYLEDYMTEKLMRTLYLGSIPIYKGAPNAKQWMPNNKSVIFVDDFATPKELADFIKKLDEDDLEYESYLNFKTEGISNHLLQDAMTKRNWRVNTPGYPDMIQSYECYVCDEVTKYSTLKKAKITEPKYANRSHFGCSQPYTLLIHPDDVPHRDV